GCGPAGKKRGRPGDWASSSPEFFPCSQGVAVGFGPPLDTVTSMNERVPDSTGLPLRAMVMVLLFLGVIFLLVGFQAMGSGSNTDDDSAVASVTTSAAASKTSAKPAAPKAEVLAF